MRKADEAETHHFCCIVSWVKLDIPSYIHPVTAFFFLNFKSFGFVLLSWT